MLKCREFSHKDARNLHPRVYVKTMRGAGLNPGRYKDTKVWWEE